MTDDFDEEAERVLGVAAARGVRATGGVAITGEAGAGGVGVRETGESGRGDSALTGSGAAAGFRFGSFLRAAFSRFACSSLKCLTISLSSESDGVSESDASTSGSIGARRRSREDREAAGGGEWIFTCTPPENAEELGELDGAGAAAGVVEAKADRD